MHENRPIKILRTLQHIYGMSSWTRNLSTNAFETLIKTVISQNTTDRNAAKAYELLSNNLVVVPETLAKAPRGQIEQCLKPAGLYRNKAKVIKQICKTILTRYHGSTDLLVSGTFEEARKKLMLLHGVGPKTADVVLLFCRGTPTIPVDTHVDRVSKRLGLVKPKADYEKVRAELQSCFDPKDYLAVHVLLIRHGRVFCRARKPLCVPCPINSLCPSKADSK